MISITTLPDELLVKIFLHLDLPDSKNAGGVCKKWRLISQEIPRALCIQVNPYATPLDNSWSKRWKAISSYDLNGCRQTIVDLQHFFFDQGFRFAPNSQRTSFYQNEVILTDDSRSCIYGCNYLNKQTRKLDVSVQGTIQNIYCHKDSLVVLTSTSVMIYDFTTEEVKELPLIEMGDLAEDLEWCQVGFYDKHFLLLLGLERTYNIDVSTGSLCASGLPMPIIDQFSDLLGTKGLRAPQSLFASQETIVAAKETGLDVFRGRELEKGLVYLPQENWENANVQSIIDGNSIAYSTQRAAEHMPVRIGADFYLGEFSTEGVVEDPTGEPLSTITIQRSFYLPLAYKATAIWASKQVCIVGLHYYIQGFQLAIWDYHKVKLIPCSEKVKHVLLLDGKILINAGGLKFRVLDFTGAHPSDAESISKHTTLTSDFSSSELKKAKNQIRVIASFTLFAAWLGVIGVGFAVVLTSYVALRSLRGLIK